ncbi:hypothetical protein SASPL_139209 [Salvia splendens]|uniref:RING-type E3 ubiquitin transferase n=1 Tax=Salvia splendens TaxID=180675 RepID=A0A8X8WYH3_SALSN|nr:U-box domain-containing protein 9-like [Salvia splendens]KAG6402331.1 hypothetical protein SASPL_139209 [Salvia splendens]
MEEIGGTERVLELKKELRRVTEALMVDDDEDGDLGVTDHAIETLRALKELKLKRSDFDEGIVKLKNLELQEPPQEFRCPISGILMNEPVVAASGQTYDELSIRKWLKEGNTKCPTTHQLLPHTALIPNHTIKNMITSWRNTTGKGDARPTRADDPRPNPTTEHLVELLETLPDLPASVRELRLLTACSSSARAFVGEINGAIPRLLSPFLIERCYSDPALYEDMVATILNISVDHSCQTKILEGSTTTTTSAVISFLSDALRSKNSDTRGHAAASLSTLSTLDANKAVIGESDAIKRLIKLLEEGHPLVSRDAAFAILNLCTLVENRERALSHGAVTVVIDKIVARVFVDEMLEILARFSGHRKAVEEMEERGMVSCLLSILGEDVGERCKENCVAIVHSMCYSDPRKLVMINEREALSRVAKTGTSRAKRKATGLLERLDRFAFVLHTM